MTVHGHLITDHHQEREYGRDTLSAIAEHVRIHDTDQDSSHWHPFGTVSIEDRDYRSEDDVAVWAIHNAGDWFLVEDFDSGELLEEIQADQCEDCGSFDEDGEPGRGFLLDSLRTHAGPPIYTCAECGTRRHATRMRGGEVIW